MMPPRFRLVGVEQTSKFGTKLEFLTGLEGDLFTDTVVVRVECRPQPGSPWNVLTYILDARGPRAPRVTLETHACAVASWLATGEGAPA